MEQFDFNGAAEKIKALLIKEGEVVDNYDSEQAINESQKRRSEATDLLDSMFVQYNHLKDDLRNLPSLPPTHEMQWAREILHLPNALFLEIDTTGLQKNKDEITRVTLIDQDAYTVYDQLIRPVSARLTDEAAHVSGINRDDLDFAPTLVECWQTIQEHIRGHYIISYNQGWDIDFINQMAIKYQLPDITIIGEDLQQHVFAWYNREYGLTLETVAARMGISMQKKPHQISIDRAMAQRHIIRSMAIGVTRVAPDPIVPAAPATEDNFLTDNSGLGDLDDHPF